MDYQCSTNANDTPSYFCYRQRKEAAQNNSNFYYKFTAGEVVSKCGYEVDYGYIEARIKYPDTKGSSSCFWTFDTDCSNLGTNAGEIDIAEVWGTNQNSIIPGLDDQFSTNIHLAYDGTDPDRSQDHNINYITNYNIYGLEWDSQTIKFYFNGQLVRTIANPNINDKLDLLLNNWLHDDYFYETWMGSDVLNTTRFNNFTNNTVSMYVDWVRVYKKRIPMVTILEKKPYLLNPEDDPNNTGKKMLTVKWQLPTNTPTNTVCTINWGTTLSYGNTSTINDNTTTNHLYEKNLTNLLPATKYYYQITGAGYTYSGDFITPPDNSVTNLSFYATGAKVPYDVSQSFNYDEISGEILNAVTQDPASQTFLVHTNGFVTADNEEFWRDEFFKYSTNSYSVRTNMPIVGPVTSYERKEKCLDFYDQIVSSKPDGIGQNFRKYLPFNYSNPYLNSNQDFEYNHSLDYGPVHICFPELEYKNTSASDVAMSYIDVDLGNTTKEWKVMSFGFPLKSLNGEILVQYATVLQKAKNNGVQLVLMGSENYYAHWVEDGIHFLILGNGGSTTNGIDDQKIGNDNQLVCASTVPHFAKFKIEDNLMFGKVVESYVQTKQILLII